MDIREIRIDQFGCWQDVAIKSLHQGLNVIHLDDGGQPVEFSRFLNGVLYGYDETQKTSAGGAVVLSNGGRAISVDRQISSLGESRLRTKENGKLVDDHRLVRQAQATVSQPLAERFFLPCENLDTAKRWEWLAQQPTLMEQLLDDDPSVEVLPDVNPEVHAVSSTRVEVDQETLNQLTTQRQQVVAEIAALELKLRQEAEPKPETSKMQTKIILAEIEDELRMLRQRKTSLDLANTLAKKWRELKKLKRKPNGDEAAIRKAFRRYKEAEEEKKSHERAFNKRPRKATRKTSSSQTSKEFAVRRMLDQRDWVLAESGSEFSVAETTDDLRFAAELLEHARVDSERADHQLRTFMQRTGFDWSSFNDDASLVERREIAEHSPLATAPLRQQLEELKRRRVWIHQDYRRVLRRQTLSSQLVLWIVILFVLSISALFGTLVVASTLGQLALAALGLCGIVSSGAIKMSLEKRAAKQLDRSRARLEQLDREITSTTEQLLGDREARSLVAVRKQQRVEATRLREETAEANRRLDSAELAFRELLLAKGLSPTLSPAEAIRRSRKSSTGSRTKRDVGSDRLNRWIKGAKKMIRHIDGECYTDEPGELLASLEFIFTQLRDQEHGPKTSSSSPRSNSTDLAFAKKELRRIEKLQRTILRRAKVHDVFELESALEEAKFRSEQARKWKRLDSEISVQLDAHEDGEEVRELLEAYDADELSRRLEDLEQQQVELEELRRTRQQESLNSESVVPRRDSQDELDRANRLLAELDAEIENVTSQIERVPEPQPVVVATKRKSRPALCLSALTDGQFDSIRFQGGRFVLENQKHGKKEVLNVESDVADLAWLALQLRLAAISQKSGNVLPVSVFADEVLSTSAASSVYRVLLKAADTGLQILLLVGSQQSANVLVDAGAAVVRIGLTEEQAKQPTEVHELAYAA